MARPNDDDIDIYELLNRADDLLDDSKEPAEDFEPEFEEDMNTDDGMVYRNAANGYTGQAVPPRPAPVAKPSQAEKAVSSIRAYNADFRGDVVKPGKAPKQDLDATIVIPSDRPAPRPVTPPPPPAPAPEKPKKQRKKGGCLPKLLIPIALILALILFVNAVFTHPVTDSPIGERRKGVSAILLCGADVGGERTDTMMLLYVDTVKRQAGLLTLPRDTYTVTDYGVANKLNSAYWRNDKGEQGMKVLLDYVQDTIGYRPDGYILVEIPVLKDLIDLFGGVEFYVPQDMNAPGKVFLEEGLQHLTGEQALGLLRFRFGYVDQDIGRQNVQKEFLKACLDQWATADNFGKLKDALSLFQSQSLTDLDTKHFLWFGWNLLTIGFGNIYTDTLPGYATMIGDQSYYVLYPGKVADMIQDRYNPYKVEITRDMLDIATE